MRNVCRNVRDRANRVGVHAKDARFGVIPMCGTCAEVCANVRPRRVPQLGRVLTAVFPVCGTCAGACVIVRYAESSCAGRVRKLAGACGPGGLPR